jgi:hypothetical protein
MIGAYIFGTICGIAVLFLLKFTQVVSKELKDLSTPQEISALHEGDMFQKKADGISVGGARPTYTIPQDFCRIFAEDQTALYLLSLVLTADSEKAEQCFVAGLEDSIHGNPVFKEWARSWSKRTIIKNAIRMKSPAPGQINPTEYVSDPRVLASDVGGLLTAVLQLAPFERFVFVMSALEGYSMQECSILLNCTKQEAAKARGRALLQLAAADIERPTRVAGRKGIRAAHFLEPLHAS